jgi:hypothetical protein
MKLAAILGESAASPWCDRTICQTEEAVYSRMHENMYAM